MPETKYLLPEDRIPRAWYNIQADLPEPMAPVLHPGTLQPLTAHAAAVSHEHHRAGDERGA